MLKTFPHNICILNCPDITPIGDHTDNIGGMTNPPA